MTAQEKFISYISTQKRYSGRTAQIYDEVLKGFYRFADSLWEGEKYDELEPLSRETIRSYQVHLLSECGDSPRTANLHLSVLSAYCRFLMRQGMLQSNPAALVTRAKQPKRLPVFYKSDDMDKYLHADNALARRDFELDMQTESERKDTYRLCLNRMIVTLLYSTGIRRAELIGLKRSSLDRSRRVLRVHGKGDKMREVPLPESVMEEIDLYLEAVSYLVPVASDASDAPLLVTWAGAAIYPAIADKAVKEELGSQGKGFSGRKSPHVLRHSFATALMEDGADLNSIKEVLGHANLAATQVYTHSSIKALKQAYSLSHPRACEDKLRKK